VIYTHAEAFLR